MNKEIRLETSENNMICLVPSKPMPKELKKKAKKALKVG
jgi:hypothetical protein